MGLFDFLFGKKPSDNLPDWAKNMYNNPPPAWQEYLKTGMIPPSTSTSTSTTNSASSSKGTNSTVWANSPFITADYAPLATLQRDTIYNRLAKGGLPEGYAAEGLRNIGESFGTASKGLQNMLASRGLLGKTAAGFDNLAGTQASAMSSFLNNLPSLARDNQTQDLGLAQGAIGQFGTGQMGFSNSKSSQNTRSTSTTDSSTTSPGGFDYAGFGQMFSSMMPYFTAPRQGGLLTPQLLGLLAGMLIPGGGGTAAQTSGVSPYYG